MNKSEVERRLVLSAAFCAPPCSSVGSITTVNGANGPQWSEDVKTRGWKVDPGKFVVYVGDSSENVPLRKNFTVR